MQDFFSIGGIRTHKKLISVGFVDKDVIQNTSILPAHHGILRLPDLQSADIIGGERLQTGFGLLSGYSNPTHMADIKQTNGLPHGMILIEHPGILNGHEPTGEIN